MDSANSPLLSVVMSVYNTPTEYLRESFRSVLDQSFRDFEFIVIDDCSSSSCAKEIESLSNQDKRVVVVRNAENLGLTKSLNKAVAIVRGKYIARMDADDVCEKKRFEKQIKFLENHSDVAVLGTLYGLIDEYGKETKRFSPKLFLDRLIKHFRTSRQLDTILFFHNSLAHPSVMMRSDIFKIEGFRYNESYRTSQDYELWCRLRKTHTISCLLNTLLMYRISPTQITQTKAQVQYQTHYQIVYSQLGELAIVPTEEQKVLHRFLCEFGKSNKQVLDAVDVVKFNSWCDFLVTQNDKTGAFDQRLFNFMVRYKQIRAVIKYFRPLKSFSKSVMFSQLMSKLLVCSVKLFL